MQRSEVGPYQCHRHGSAHLVGFFAALSWADVIAGLRVGRLIALPTDMRRQYAP